MKKRMNFRQRLAWGSVIFYLFLTVIFVFFVVGNSDNYTAFAVEHVEQYHKSDSLKSDKLQNEYQTLHSWQISLWSLLYHLSDVPLVIWIVMLVLPYLQVFCMLLACTKPEPRHSIAFIWPCVVCTTVGKMLHLQQNSQLPTKAMNSYHVRETNVQSVIET